MTVQKHPRFFALHLIATPISHSLINIMSNNISINNAAPSSFTSIVQNNPQLQVLNIQVPIPSDSSVLVTATVTNATKSVPNNVQMKRKKGIADLFFTATDKL